MAAFLSSLRLFGRLGSLFDETQVSTGGTPANGYVLEDGTTFYVAEDNTTFYVQEV